MKRSIQSSRGIMGFAVLTLVTMASAAFAQDNIALKARGEGFHDDGSSFLAMGKYLEKADKIKNIFKIRHGMSEAEYTFCVSTDECTFQVTLTTNARGRAKLKYSSRDGTLPDDFPQIREGDILMVNGQEIDVYRHPD